MQIANFRPQNSCGQALAFCISDRKKSFITLIHGDLIGHPGGHLIIDTAPANVGHGAVVRQLNLGRIEHLTVLDDVAHLLILKKILAQKCLR